MLDIQFREQQRWLEEQQSMRRGTIHNDTPPPNPRPLQRQNRQPTPPVPNDIDVPQTEPINPTIARIPNVIPVATVVGGGGNATHIISNRTRTYSDPVVAETVVSADDDLSTARCGFGLLDIMAIYW